MNVTDEVISSAMRLCAKTEAAYGFMDMTTNEAKENWAKFCEEKGRLLKLTTAALSQAPMAQDNDPAILYQEAEERLCECGAAGSGEGHSDFCPWLESAWKRWGDALNAAPMAQDIGQEGVVSELRRMMSEEERKRFVEPIVGGPEGETVLGYNLKGGYWLMLQARLRLLLDKLATHPVPADQPPREGEDLDRMQKISEVITHLQSIRDRFGETCVYIRRGGMSWGAVALNRRDDDKKHGVFTLQAQHDRDMTARAQQIERLMTTNRDLRAQVAALSGGGDE